MKAGVAACVLAAVLLAARARANDGVMGGSGSDLVPMKTTAVSMLSEDIAITYADRAWHVDASYQFRNDSPGEVKLQLGFPEYRCEDTEGDCVSRDAFRFENMRTEVRGQPVEHRKGKVSDKHAWAPRLGGVWLFDVTFAPGETVPVRHTYEVPSGYVVDGTQDTTYVTRTGALWAGPIGHASFRVRVPLKTTELFEPEPEAIKRAGVSFPVIDGNKVAELRYDARDWSPSGDLSFGFREGVSPWDVAEDDLVPDGPARSGLGDDERCQSFGKLWSAAWQMADPNPEPDAEADFDAAIKTGINTRRICKNMVFALHGRRFQDERLNRYFYGAKGFVPGEWPYARLQPNPDYDSSWLSKGDWKMIELSERLPEARAATAQREPASDAPAANATPAATAPAAPAKSAEHAAGCGCASCAPARSGVASALLAFACMFSLRLRRRSHRP